MAPAKTGIERLSSIISLQVVSTNVATKAIARDKIRLFKIKVAIIKSTTNSERVPSQVRFE